MKYVSIDIETTGTDRENHQILSIGCIIEDTNNMLPISEMPQIHIGVIRTDINCASMFALNLNRNLIETLVKWQHGDEYQKKQIETETKMIFKYEEDVVKELFDFFYVNNLTNDGNDNPKGNIPQLSSKMEKLYLTCAGKNFATFDKIFLERLPRWKQAFSIRQRILDPTILYVDWVNDKDAPGMEECKKRAGLGEIVTHNALEDAIDVVNLLRKKY